MSEPVIPALTAAPTPDVALTVPLDMVLFCPACGLQHVDEPTPGKWDNPPHRSHLCAGCGHIWRPADFPTNGVTEIATRGQYDSEPIRNHGRVPVFPRRP